MQVTVLGVQTWAIKNEDGSIKDGISVHYFDIADHSQEADKIGVFPASITADKSLLNKFSSLPGKYNFDLRLRRGAGGKAKPVLIDVEHIEKQPA